MPRIDEPLPICPFCLSTAKTCRVAFTKYNRPMLRAMCCGTRVFAQSLEALAGFAVAQPYLVEVVHRAMKDATAYEAQEKVVDAFTAPLKAAFAELQTVGRGPQMTSAAALADEQQPRAAARGR
jgi:hypothetical protein